MNKVKGAANHIRTILLSLVAGSVMAGLASYAPDARAAVSCSGGTVTANVVAIDQPIMFNRLGAQNVNYMIYALRRDVVDYLGDPLPPADGDPIPTDIDGEGRVSLREDKRPRPLVLRVAAGECLEVRLQNLLTETANPFKNGDEAVRGRHAHFDNPIMQINNQVEGRYIGFHPLGLQLVNNIDDDSAETTKTPVKK